MRVNLNSQAKLRRWSVWTKATQGSQISISTLTVHPNQRNQRQDGC